MPVYLSGRYTIKGENNKMCVAVPMKIIQIKDREAIVELDGIKKEVNMMLTGDIKVGDYVMIHAGFAIQKVNPDEVEKTLEVLKEYANKIKEENS